MNWLSGLLALIQKAKRLWFLMPRITATRLGRSKWVLTNFKAQAARASRHMFMFCRCPIFIEVHIEILPMSDIFMPSTCSKRWFICRKKGHRSEHFFASRCRVLPDKSSFPMVIFPLLTIMLAKEEPSALRMKFKPDLGVRVRISGRLKRKASFPISSQWESRSATDTPWQRW